MINVLWMRQLATSGRAEEINCTFDLARRSKSPSPCTVRCGADAYENRATSLSFCRVADQLPKDPIPSFSLNLIFYITTWSPIDSILSCMKQFPGHPRAMQRVKRPSIPTCLLFRAALLETAPNSSRIDKSNHKIQGLLWYIFPFFLFYLTSRDHQEQLHLTGKFTRVSCLGWTQRLAL